MKTIFCIITLLLYCINITAQDIKNGNYISNRTSFQDFNNSENNFVEEAQYNLTIQIQNNEGIILIQDPRIPDKPLIYRVYSKGKEVSKDNTKAYFYNAYTEHLKRPLKTYIGVYKSKDKPLNLMVADSLSSQVFHCLKGK